MNWARYINFGQANGLSEYVEILHATVSTSVGRSRWFLFQQCYRPHSNFSVTRFKTTENAKSQSRRKFYPTNNENQVKFLVDIGRYYFSFNTIKDIKSLQIGRTWSKDSSRSHPHKAVSKHESICSLEINTLSHHYFAQTRMLENHVQQINNPV